MDEYQKLYYKLSLYYPLEILDECTYNELIELNNILIEDKKRDRLDNNSALFGALQYHAILTTGDTKKPQTKKTLENLIDVYVNGNIDTKEKTLLSEEEQRIEMEKFKGMSPKEFIQHLKAKKSV